MPEVITGLQFFDVYGNSGSDKNKCVFYRVERPLDMLEDNMKAVLPAGRNFQYQVTFGNLFQGMDIDRRMYEILSNKREARRFYAQRIKELSEYAPFQGTVAMDDSGEILGVVEHTKIGHTSFLKLHCPSKIPAQNPVSLEDNRIDYAWIMHSVNNSLIADFNGYGEHSLLIGNWPYQNGNMPTDVKPRILTPVTTLNGQLYF